MTLINLPPTFAFSQSSLQAYENCPRRFWLAYVERLPWPAVEASPIQEHEALMRLGAMFHRIVERAEIGIESERLQYGLRDVLGEWFQAYLDHRPRDLPTEFVETERVLSIPFGNTAQSFRLAAKYDLIAASGPSSEQPSQVTIVDWKTSKKRPDPGGLGRRLQTIVYPFVLVEASQRLPFGPIAPEQVEMLYWFTNAPTQPIRFHYDSAQHERNRERLSSLFNQVAGGATEADFPKVADSETSRRRVCGYCIYRSRCNRGATAADLAAIDDVEDFFTVDLESALEFTLDDVEELSF